MTYPIEPKNLKKFAEACKLPLPDYKLTEDQFLKFAHKAIMDSSSFNPKMHHLKIKNPKLRLKVAEMSASVRGSWFAQYVQNFQITDQDQRFCLAKIAFSSNCWHNISPYIQNFEITNQDYLFELAKLAAEKDKFDFCRYVHQFGIKDQDRRYELAKMGIWDSKYLGNYDITDPERLYELAKINAEKNCYSLSENIQEYRITDQDRLFEIAMMALLKDTASVCKNIKNYEIKDPEKLYQIAKKAADANGAALSEYIANFEITDPEKLFELAKIAVRSQSSGTSEFIQNYGITDQDRLFEIAMLAAKTENFGIGPSEFIKKYGIIDPYRRYQIAKLSAREIGFFTIRHLENYEITDKKHLREILFAGYTHMGEVFISSQYSIFDDFLEEYGITATIPEELQKFLQKIELCQNPILKKKFQYIFKIFEILCKLHPNQELLISFLNHNPELLSTIFEQRDPHFYWPLLNSILSQQEPKTLANSVEKQMVALLCDNKNILKSDVHDVHLRTPLMSLLCTTQCSNKILDWVAENPKNKKQIITRCWIIRAVQNLGGNLNDAISETSLSELFQKMLPNLNIENFQTRLQETFFQMRNPLAIFIYAGRLAIDKNNNLINLLTLFVNSILEGKFKQLRQDIARNPQLKFLDENHPEILKLYHQGSSKQIDLEESKKEAIHITLRQIIEKSLSFQHLKETDFLKIDMQHIPSNERNFYHLHKQNLSELTTTIRSLSQEKNKNRSNPKEFIRLNSYLTYLKLQQSLLKLMDENVTKGDYNECHTAFNNSLNKKSEFLNDLNSMAALFSKTNESNQITLHDTDDPYEIMLCGTEVEGSCQRIDGDPQSNKGLLGYLLNGQTRLITLKTNDTIKGRVIIRLLIDKYNQPVLFLEDVYPRTLDSKYKKAIIDFAKEKAKELNIPLTSPATKEGYVLSLRNLGNLAPEYVDSASGIHESYQINGTLL